MQDNTNLNPNMQDATHNPEFPRLPLSKIETDEQFRDLVAFFIFNVLTSGPSSEPVDSDKRKMWMGTMYDTYRLYLSDPDTDNTKLPTIFGGFALQHAALYTWLRLQCMVRDGKVKASYKVHGLITNMPKPDVGHDWYAKLFEHYHTPDLSRRVQECVVAWRTAMDMGRIAQDAARESCGLPRHDLFNTHVDTSSNTDNTDNATETN